MGVKKEERGWVHGEPNCVYRILHGSMYCVIMYMCVCGCMGGARICACMYVQRCVLM